MKRKAFILPLAAAMLLLGCAGIAPPLAVQPLLAVRDGGVDAEGMYRIGRSYQGQGRHAEAARAFRAALALDPAHAEARNALGASYFAQGWIEAAEQQFRAAIAAAPTLAHLRSNLARLLALTGRAPAEGASPVAAAQALPAPAPSGAPVAEGASRLVSVATNVWELKAAATPPVEIAPPALAGAAADQRAWRQRVEVSNGNGVRGLARRVAQFIGTQGYPLARTSNLPQFNQRRTEVQYQPGARHQAQELAALLVVPARQVAGAAPQSEAGVRLVLGHDFKAAPGAGGGDPLAME